MSTPTTKKRTVTDAGLPDDAADDVPCCWLCLEEGPDESGKPLERDCSCRGTSSFAHLLCIVGWAENEGKRMRENEERLVGTDVMKTFTDCPNCKQSYQNDLGRNLASAAVDFIEKEFGGIENGELRASALSAKLVTLDANNREYIVKGEEICSKLLALIEEMKNIDEFQRNWESRFLSMEANAYLSVGAFHLQVGASEENEGSVSKEHLKKGKEYFVKARNLCAANMDPVALTCLESALHLHAIEALEGRVEFDKENSMTM